MKSVTLVIITLCLTQVVGNAQTWDEWFRQRKTQEKYLMQQVAALKVYLRYLTEGYDIACRGLNTIGEIKDGNFDNHHSYFSSLRKVNSLVGETARLPMAVAYQQQIKSAFARLQQEVYASKQLLASEKHYVQTVQDNMLATCAHSVAQLRQVVTEDAVQLTDDERSAQIKIIQDELQEHYAFTNAFCNSTRLLIAQRQREQFELTQSEYLNAATHD